VSTSTQVQIGSDFLGYRIEELIGQGGMGVVYRAYDLRLKRTVALKLIVPELALDERFHARFARETELAMSLEHPNVVPVYDAGDVDGRFYLAMRLVEGTDLGALLRAEGALDPARAFAICSQVANALDAAHGKDLVHRDVKPSNVLLDKGEHVYLADFGLTRRLEEQGAQAGEGRSVGTPAYLAPEQIEGGPVDGRADIYSLGCLLYECLTGEAPFLQDSRLAIAWAHLEEEPPKASTHNSDLPGAVDDVIRKAMAKSRDDRYPTCTALIAAGEEALELRQPPMLRMRRRPVITAAATLLVVAGTALAVALVMRNDGQSAVSAPTVRENSLVRIDPATNTISDVVGVGGGPSATAVGGQSVWVYNRDDATVTEIDATTNEVRKSTRISGIAVDLGPLTGPVLAADSEGAWIVGVDGGRSLLTRILSSARGKREYRLGLEPRAVAAGAGALWVLGRGTRGSQVLRVDPATGDVTARTRFSASALIDSLGVGLGAVWVVSSSKGTLYRINPGSGAVTGHTDLGGKRAGRPAALFGNIWVALPDNADTVLVSPHLLTSSHLGCCEEDDNVGAFDSVWAYDADKGTVQRWNPNTLDLEPGDPVIAVTDPPLYGGSCLTSIAAGAGGVWITAAPSIGYTCPR
jgi:serine/threonine-protein kinase